MLEKSLLEAINVNEFISLILNKSQRFSDSETFTHVETLELLLDLTRPCFLATSAALLT